MLRLLVLIIVVSLGSNALVAAGPLEEAAKKTAPAQRAAQASKVSNHSSRKPLLWTGLALAGAGTGLMLWGMERCDNLGGTIRQCSGSDSLKWLGVGTAAAGGVLIGVGASKQSVLLVRPASISYRLKF